MYDSRTNAANFARAKRMRVGRRSVAGDLGEARIADLAGQIEVTVEPRRARHDGGEAHPCEKDDARFLRNHFDWPAGFDELAQSIECITHRARLAAKMILQLPAATRVRHMSCHEARPALRALPQISQAD